MFRLVFGGQGLTSQIVTKVHELRSGQNFDATVGFDLRDPDAQDALFQYIHSHAPLVAVMAPPCRGFRQLQHINKVIHPSSWASARQEGELLSQLCAAVAEAQVSAGRAFIAEQPKGSDMFSTPCWQ